MVIFFRDSILFAFFFHLVCCLCIFCALYIFFIAWILDPILHLSLTQAQINFAPMPSLGFHLFAIWNTKGLGRPPVKVLEALKAQEISLFTIGINFSPFDEDLDYESVTDPKSRSSGALLCIAARQVPDQTWTLTLLCGQLCCVAVLVRDKAGI